MSCSSYTVDVFVLVCRAGQLSAELKQGSSAGSNDDRVCVLKTSSSVEMKHHDSSSSISSKDGSVDAKHFIEVSFAEPLLFRRL